MNHVFALVLDRFIGSVVKMTNLKLASHQTKSYLNHAHMSGLSHMSLIYNGNHQLHHTTTH